MYYEEKMINGILHYRTSPNDEFEEYSKEALSRRIEDNKIKLQILEEIARNNKL